ncbi:DUF859 family phage minor structural protein [Bariatricus sp. HCP28S3_E4]|uniref:DUF859 family phage minor structural protein n=2 Tax=Bariatricus TaxID=1924081 RepID=UPI003F888C38
MALQTKTITCNGSNGHHAFTLTVTENSTSTSNNTSSVSFNFKLSSVKTGYDWNYSNNVPVTYSINFNGTTYSGNIMSYNGSSTVTLKSGSATIPHNSDGTKSISYSFSVSSISASYLPGSASKSGSMTLTAIPRQATITSAPNFNDEENPTISYNNGAGNTVTSLQACISLDGSKDDIAYRDISKTSSSYTFNLTDAERNVLRNACTTSNSRNVIFFVQTVLNGQTYRSTLTKTLNIVNATPTIEATAKDTNSTSLELTGSENKIIKGYNTIAVNMTATALKGATISSYKITNGSNTINSSSGEFNNVESESFDFTVTDSRGNTFKKTLVKTLVDYIRPTANVKADISPDGIITGTISGNFFNGSFGSKSNTLSVQYNYKTVDGSYGSWKSATATKSGNTYTADFTISGLDYRNKYVVRAMVFDKLYTKYSNEPTLNCLPVFDWSENDFNFNVPINVSGNVSLSGELTIGDTNVLDEISTINNNLFNLNYETSEVKTGEVWIDGKPIYRKVFQVSAIQSKVVTINHNISNANIVWVDTSHSFLLVGNNTYSLPRIGNSINQCVGVQATRSTFTISAGSDASFSGGAIVTLLYTKTT